MPDIWMDVDANLSEVPVNIFPLIDDTDFKSRETTVAYNAAGMDLVWNFVTCAGAYTQTNVTPTTGGNYDWAHQGDGMYSIEIPASGGATINNDTEGFGWFSGIATGVLPWRGPVIGFRAAGLNDKMIESAYDTTRGLAGTALPAAAADAAGGLPISDDGGLDLDSKLANTNEVTAARLSELDAGTGGKMANDVAEILTDTGTTLPALLPSSLVSGRIRAHVEAQDNIDFGALQKASLNAATPASVTGAVGSVTGAVGSVTAAVTLAAGQLVFKKNVARANFAFPMFDSTGALKSGLTVTAAIRKDDGASFAELSDSVSEIGSTGWYTVDWAQAETNADTIAFSASASGANPTCYTILTQA